jgi:hypothetical protein
MKIPGDYHVNRLGAVVLAGALLFAAPACAQLSGVEGGRPGARNAFVDGEIRSIDQRRGRLDVRVGSGRTQQYRVDRNTRVVYQQRQYPVSSLGRGDLVRVRLVYDRNGTAWADRIDVRRSTSNRGVAAARAQRLDGVVAGVDRRRGHFTVQSGRTTVAVYLPARVNASDVRRFEQLRRGDRVRVEVRAVSRDRAELVRFR